MNEGGFIVYRYFDSAGALLYAGYTANMLRRTRAHYYDSWWKDVRSRNIEVFPDEQTARAAETVAIRMESPIHNKLGTAPKAREILTEAESQARIDRLLLWIRERKTA